MKMKKYIVGLFFICLTIISLMLAGCGSDSSTAPATVAQAKLIPPSPTGVTATGGSTQVIITWDAAPGATSYNIYWLKSPGGTTPIWTKITNATSPYVHTGLAGGTIYNYIVSALSSAGESVPSSQVFPSTDTLPVAPTMV